REDDARTRARFDALAIAHAGDVRAVDWGSRASQELRFSVLASIADLNGARVLDVGCGQGDLYAWLCARGIRCDYSGIDLSPEMVALARKRFPERSFEVGNLLDTSAVSAMHDYVLASGIFYLRAHQPEQYMQTMVERMFARCTRGLAFNSLSSWGEGAPDPAEYRADPLRALAMARDLTRRVSLRHDYHPRDFTLLLHKDAPR
ncbi:MAG: methyltransferase domain-containing protein, partial [Planctomycetota bacterium]